MTGPGQEERAGPDALAGFHGPPEAYWPAFLEYGARLAGAKAALLACRTRNADGSPGAWGQAFAWPASGPESEPGPREALRRAAAELADAAWEAGAAARGMRVPGYRAAGALLGVRIVTDGDETPAAAFFHVAEAPDEAETGRLLELLRQAGALPAAFQARRRAAGAAADARRMGAVLDLLAVLNREHRFLASAMTLCNEVAGRYRCDRVSLGWQKGDYLRLQAVSHAEKFEKRMASVRRLEIAMEEALDQDEEIAWPPPAGAAFVAREHEALARDQGSAHLVSLPLRRGDRAVAVLLCERAAEAFGEAEIAHLRLLCDQAAPRLADLRERDRWFGARALAALRRGLAKLAGAEHTWAKVGAVGGAAALAYLCLAPMPFRVQAPFLVKADTTAHLPAPFDGYLAEVGAEPGDVVAPGATLLKLDTRELLLEEAAAVADRQRYLRESEKARAENALAAMRIAAAQAEQARVRLELARYRISQAAVTSRFDGVVVEGDLRERIGAPVRQGETLLRVARLDRLYAELEIDQRDVREVRAGSTVRLAFASRPAGRIEARVLRIEPVAQVREGRNVFVARCALAAKPEGWMRPGMTGVGKVEAGTRSPIRILTRRTVDLVRLHVW